MGYRWLCTPLIIMAIVVSTHTQNIINKWTLDERISNKNIDGNSKSNFKINTLTEPSKLTQESEVDLSNSKQFENLLQAETDGNQRGESTKVHSRKKRLIWVTDDGRLALPPGTVLSIAPTLSMPLIRYPVKGFLSNLTMSFPLTIDFDSLGLTDNENPLGVVPPFFGRSMGRAAGTMLGNYIGSYLNSRKKRSIEGEDNVGDDSIEELPDGQKHVFHGGERALLYGAVEDLISTFGLDGKACLLRAICEVHSKSIHHLGLFGEMLKLFFTASKSQFSQLLPEYVSAEEVGQGVRGPGECFPYYKNCPRSLFKADNNKYSEHMSKDKVESEKLIQLQSNEIDSLAESSQKSASKQDFNM
ncbi:hypothetical protein Bhyg_06808 [Pseudolycoriella hygida]|uniref:Secreted protein n=1 Tax=Pseudolycoriella hygida TaxID=35572 RepID=A0A9Q0S2T0_9DIPT|nr:hypothetical protein Bhyg_06808 [Pseudolycoriella hygida]